MKEIKKLIEHFDGEVYDLCYKLLSENEEHAEIFQFVCENLLKTPDYPSIKINKYWEKEEIDKYVSIYGDMVDSTIKNVIQKCAYGMIEVEEFYEKLWESYSSSATTLKEKAFVFYYTILDRRIPYIYIGEPLSMAQEKYEAILNKNKGYLKKIENIFDASFNQKTEVASLVLQCINRIEDYEGKVVALARAMEMNAKKTKNKSDIERAELVRVIDQRIEEFEARKK